MGAIFHNGKPFGGGGILNLVTKSWSDYNALSLEERNDSTKWYFVPDAPASGVPNIVKSVRDNITDAYDPESTYNKDDWCIYDNKLYICTTNNTTGEWDSTKWTRKNLEEIIGSVKSDIAGNRLLNPDSGWIMNNDANNITDTGIYNMGTGNSNLPQSWTILLVIKGRSDVIRQFAMGTSGFYFRGYQNNTWSNWVLIN